MAGGDWDAILLVKNCSMQPFRAASWQEVSITTKKVHPIAAIEPLARSSQSFRNTSAKQIGGKE